MTGLQHEQVKPLLATDAVVILEVTDKDSFVQAEERRRFSEQDAIRQFEESARAAELEEDLAAARAAAAAELQASTSRAEAEEARAASFQAAASRAREDDAAENNSGTPDRFNEPQSFQSPMAAFNMASPRPAVDRTRERTVSLLRGNDGFGLRVTSQEGVPGIRITHITPGGVADRTLKLFVDDYLLSVRVALLDERC